MSTPRPAPRDCRNEPPYPGLTTTLHVLWRPDLTVHEPTPLCATQGPHDIAECGEWTA